MIPANALMIAEMSDADYRRWGLAPQWMDLFTVTPDGRVMVDLEAI